MCIYAPKRKQQMGYRVGCGLLLTLGKFLGARLKIISAQQRCLQRDLCGVRISVPWEIEAKVGPGSVPLCRFVLGGQRDVWKGHGCKWGMAGGMFRSAAHLDHRLLDSCPLRDSIRVWIDVGLAALQRPASPSAMEILTKVQVHSTLAIPVHTQPPPLAPTIYCSARVSFHILSPPRPLQPSHPCDGPCSSFVYQVFSMVSNHAVSRVMGWWGAHFLTWLPRSRRDWILDKVLRQPPERLGSVC